MAMGSSASIAATPAKISPRVVQQKSAIPVLWLDTSVAIKLVRIRRGEKLNEIEIVRCIKLRELILGLVKDGKLLCPMSDQEEEFEAYRLDSEVYAEFSRLSQGARMVHRIGIQDAQILRAMDAFCQGHGEIKLPWRIYFHEDPVKAIEREKGRRIIVSVTTPAKSPIIEARREHKQDKFRKMEELRQKLTAKGQNYESQFKVESDAFGHEAIRIIRDIVPKLMTGRADMWEHLAVSGFLEYFRRWMQLGRHPRSFYEFMISDYVALLPIIRITSQLNADLITGNQPVLSGDPADVDLLSTALPLAQFVLADRRMANRVKRLGIDQEWGTKVFSMSTIEGLFAELETLRQQAA